MVKFQKDGKNGELLIFYKIILLKKLIQTPILKLAYDNEFFVNWVGDFCEFLHNFFKMTNIVDWRTNVL